MGWANRLTSGLLRGGHAAMRRRMALQATLGENGCVTVLVLMRIVTRGACHFGLLKALAHRQSSQLVAGVNSAHALKVRIDQLVMFAQVIAGTKRERFSDQRKAAGMALAADVELSLS